MLRRICFLPVELNLPPGDRKFPAAALDLRHEERQIQTADKCPAEGQGNQSLGERRRRVRSGPHAAGHHSRRSSGSRFIRSDRSWAASFVGPPFEAVVLSAAMSGEPWQQGGQQRFLASIARCQCLESRPGLPTLYNMKTDALLQRRFMLHGGSTKASD